MVVSDHDENETEENKKLFFATAVALDDYEIHSSFATEPYSYCED